MEHFKKVKKFKFWNKKEGNICQNYFDIFKDSNLQTLLNLLIFLKTFLDIPQKFPPIDHQEDYFFAMHGIKPRLNKNENE